MYLFTKHAEDISSDICTIMGIYTSEDKLPFAQDTIDRMNKLGEAVGIRYRYEYIPENELLINPPTLNCQHAFTN
jgi:DNA helicase TIP49 (TBP-interacting protein)